jgi:heterotetrameric sarcosine oxidase gamma subunit
MSTRRTSVSAPDRRGAPPELRPLEADVVEFIAREAKATTLPAPGTTHATDGALLLAVRPGRAYRIGSPAAPGAALAALPARDDDTLAAVDLSSAFAVFELAGVAAAEVLARGCRLDLGAGGLGAGHAAATTLAQVTVVLAPTRSGYLLLVPRSYARHCREWLLASGRPFGLVLAPSTPFHDPFGDPER